jgi:hypothetical protein
MSLSKLFIRTTVFAICSAFLAAAAHAQYRASIQGVVTDPQGAVASGATVTLKNLETNQTQTTTTDENGIFNFGALPPSQYSVTVEKTGFKKKVLDKVGVIAEQANALNIQLEVGEVTQSVTVNGDSTPLLDTETASVNGTISGNQIQNMPSFGRDVFQLIQLAPGVFGDGRQGGGGGSVNLPGTQGPGGTGGNQGIFQTENGPQALAGGQQYENNSITVDGISTTSAVWGGTTIITPTEDSVDSVKVVANDYDAENGRFSGTQIQVISKGGTNQYHGSIFVTAHRPGLNAYQAFNGLGNRVLRDNNFFTQAGGSVGGPIWKNKLFAFFAYETVRSPQAQTNIANGWYDTAAFDALAPSGSIASKYLTFPGSGVVSIGINNSTCANAGLVEGVNCRTIPGQGLNLGTPLTAALGNQDQGWSSASNPGCGGAGTGCGTLGSPLGTVADIANYVTASKSNTTKNQYNGRLDANILTNDRIAFAMYYVPQSASFLNGPARQYNFFNHSQINEAFSAIWDHTISSTFLNEFRVNAAGWRWNEVNSNPQSPVGLPSDNIDTIGSITVQQFGPNVGSILNQWTYTFKDVATKVRGRHTIKFGGEVTRLFYLQDCAGCGVPNYNFFNLWDFLNDAPQREGGGFDPHTGFPSTLRQDQRSDIWGLFVQDDFKLRSNLTLNLGLRWSYFGPLSSKEGNMYVATPGAGANYMTGLVVRKGHSWNAEKDNLGPQVGFAWSPTSLLHHEFGNRLVIRGGYGLSYNQEEIAISANISQNPGLVVFPSFTMATPGSPNPGIIYATSSNVHSLSGYPSNPNTVASFNSNGLPASGAQVNVQIFPNDLPTMRVHHYSLEAQYDLGHEFVATLGYQGSVDHNTFFHENPNALPAASGFTLNPQVGGGDYWGVAGRGNYNAMLAEVNHRFSHQFLADAQFTWAKCMDTASSPYSSTLPPFNLPIYLPNLDLNYGRCDYNFGKALKLFGMYQPVFFHSSRSWMEKIVGGWSLSGILNLHSGFPWTPVVSVVGGSLYCGTCGYGTLFPAAYLGGAGTSTSNDAFKTGSNFPKGGAAYFSKPTYTAYTGSNFGNANPQSPGVHRNSFNGPGYRDLDLTLAKAFGLPKAPVLGENAKIEFRLDAYNVFNTLNFKPDSISNNIANANFGQMTSALAARVVTLGARFSF